MIDDSFGYDVVGVCFLVFVGRVEMSLVMFDRNDDVDFGLFCFVIVFVVVCFVNIG